MMHHTIRERIQEIELKALLEAIFQSYGYDFRNYAVSSLKRRIKKSMEEEGIETISSFQSLLLHDPEAMERFLNIMSIDVTEMFRDPGFFLVFRNVVVPFLKTYPYIRIWHAGAASGEEVYSLAILLHEEGILKRSIIYATDINELLLEKAKQGIFPIREMKKYTENYIAAGGKVSFSDYYIAEYDDAIIKAFLKTHMVFGQHNLATDTSFNEFNVIFCRNVMIYFNNTLQNQVHNLFYDSLAMFGYLGLGAKESISFTPHEHDYEPVNPDQKIYRKVR